MLSIIGAGIIFLLGYLIGRRYATQRAYQMFHPLKDKLKIKS